MDYAVLVLQCAFDEKEFAARYYQPVAVIKFWGDDHIGDASLVFH